MEEREKNELLRQLPSVDALLVTPNGKALLASHGRSAAVRAARRAVAEARAVLLDGDFVAPDTLLEPMLLRDLSPGLRRVLNASGVILHTNLGRAPLAEEALAAMAEVAGYCNLEFDLDSGERGSRFSALKPLLCELTEAEDCVVVNNCAGAVLLLLASLGAGRECVVSRGELVEIGGGFRIPDVMAQSGVRLKEVGTTNKTRLSDYAGAVGPETALLAKVHRSNFALVGFTEEVTPAALAALAHSRELLAIEDLGSGCLTEGLGERTVREAIRDGMDAVAFSGDKLCGGPQAGVVVGKREVLSKLAAHPLARALRIDKCAAAALEATLRLHRDGRVEAIPALRAMSSGEQQVLEKARRLGALLSKMGVASQTVSSVARVGGGSSPLRELKSHAVAFPGREAARFAQALRAGTPAVLGLIRDEMLLLDLRAVEERDLEPLASAVAAALRTEFGTRAGTQRGSIDA